MAAGQERRPRAGVGHGVGVPCGGVAAASRDAGPASASYTEMTSPGAVCVLGGAASGGARRRTRAASLLAAVCLFAVALCAVVLLRGGRGTPGPQAPASSACAGDLACW